MKFKIWEEIVYEVSAPDEEEARNLWQKARSEGREKEYEHSQVFLFIERAIEDVELP